MKTLDEVIAIKNQLEKKLIGHPAVVIMEIGASGQETKLTGSEEYIIRIFVNNPAISYRQLGISAVYQEVPVIVQYRNIELQG